MPLLRGDSGNLVTSDLSLILDLVAREMARKHTAFYNIGFSLLLDRLRDFVVVPSSAGGNSSFELHSQRAWRSVPLWTATITSMATRACAPD